jgi:hypothetical protein
MDRVCVPERAHVVLLAAEAEAAGERGAEGG